MIITRSTALRNARAATHVTALNGGDISIYTGAMPVNGGAITDQVLLGVMSFNTPCGVVDNGSFVLDISGLEVMAAANGTATWARLNGSAGWVSDMDMGEAGSGAAIIAAPVQVYAGGILRIASFRLTER